MLLDSTVVVAAVVRTRPRAIPLVRITTRKSIHGFPSVFYMGMGLRLAALRAAGAPLLLFLFSWLFSSHSASIRRLVHGHMTSSNETVYRQMP